MSMKWVVLIAVAVTFAVTLAAVAFALTITDDDPAPIKQRCKPTGSVYAPC